MPDVRPARASDLEQWLHIARQVEPLFGPMPGFRGHAMRGIDRGTALVAAEGPLLLGACLLSRDGRPQVIHWLTVAEGHHGNGIGSLLLAAILSRWPTGDISVSTFTAALPEGEPARRLYTSKGFRRVGAAPPAPDGGARDLYVLPRRADVRR